ncbi:hypothetical protein V1278_001104 [Bradyrhizobium sp. AZCC 1577]
MKARLGQFAAAAIVENFRRLPFRELRDVPNHVRIVEGQLGIETAKAVAPGCQRQIVEGGKILDMDPRRPGCGEPAGRASRTQALRRGADLGPGLRRHLRVEAGGAEQILVVVEDWGRDIEREREHIAGDVGIVAGHGRQIRLRRERLRLVAHQLEHRIDRPFCRHHGCGGDLVDLNDGGLASRSECEDRRRHRRGVVALVGRHDPVVGLRRIEIGRQLFELLAEFPRHRVPPHDLGGGGVGGGRKRHGGERCELQEPQGRFHR